MKGIHDQLFAEVCDALPQCKGCRVVAHIRLSGALDDGTNAELTRPVSSSHHDGVGKVSSIA